MNYGHEKLYKFLKLFLTFSSLFFVTLLYIDTTQNRRTTVQHSPTLFSKWSKLAWMCIVDTTFAIFMYNVITIKSYLHEKRHGYEMFHIHNSDRNITKYAKNRTESFPHKYMYTSIRIDVIQNVISVKCRKI